MKKIIFIILCLLLFTGCEKETKQKEVKKIKEEVKEEYKDLNNTPIGIYELKGNTLTRVNNITKHLNVEEDIVIFQVFPSTEEKVNLTSSFGESFYSEWNKYKDIKQGFNIKYYLDNKEVSYNILSPNETFKYWEYLMNYLYDDYINKDKSFYSHLEDKDYNENSLLTSIKLQASYNCSEIKKIELTAFTYDSEDDLINDTYRGNSKYMVTINTN